MESEAGSNFELTNWTSNQIDAGVLNTDCVQSNGEQFSRTVHVEGDSHEKNLTVTVSSIILGGNSGETTLKKQNNCLGENAKNNNHNIPFVQIHTIDVQSLRRNVGNSFCRSAKSEIKSEPIKSENSDIAKDIINDTAGTPVQSSRWNTDELIEKESIYCSNYETNTTAITKSSGDFFRTPPFPRVHKCKQCTYISLSASAMASHIHITHCNCVVNDIEKQTLRLRIPCPGCDNIFHSYKSIETHLCEDHLIMIEDCKRLMEAVEGKYPSLDSSHLCKDKLPKSRIYLKNVECLRDPQHEPIQQQQNQFTENFFQLNDFINDCPEIINDEVDNAFLTMLQSYDDIESPNNIIENVQKSSNHKDSKQISRERKEIRESVLTQRNHEFQNVSYLLNICNDVDLAINSNDHTCENKSSDNLIRNETLIMKKPPKNDKNYISQTNNFISTNQPRQDNNYMNLFASTNSIDFPSPKTIKENDVSINILSAKSCNSEPTNSSMTIFSGSTSTETVTVPKYQTQLKQEFFIKNFDMLKERQYQQHRGTLHLRTVDELNLMNKIEVQNLIAPNLENTQTLGDPQTKFDVVRIDVKTTPSKCAESQVILNLNENFHLNDNFNCVIPDSITSTSTEATELGAPLMSLVSFRNVDLTSKKDSVGIPISIGDLSSLGVGDTAKLTHKKTTSNCNENIQVSHAEQSKHITLMTPTRTRDQLSTSSKRIVPKCNSINTYTNAVVESITQKSRHSPASSSRLTLPIPPLVSVNSSVDPKQLFLTPSYSPDIFLFDDKDTSSKYATLATVSVPPCVSATSAMGTSTVSLLTPTFKRNSIYATAQIKNTTSVTAATLTRSIITPTDFKSQKIAEKFNASILLPVENQTSPTSTNNTVRLGSDNDFIIAFSKASNCNHKLTELSSKKRKKYEEVERLATAASSKTSILTLPSAPSLDFEQIPKVQSLESKKKKDRNKIEKCASYKCSVLNCSLKFHKTEILQYHLRCHKNSTERPKESICPECKNENFKTWPALHSHLWRVHKVDMELYSCIKCSFKTPSYSHLTNTHLKIHSETRNFKCEQCNKGFKNSKQLKNHRRIHRVRVISQTSIPVASEFLPTTEVLANVTESLTTSPLICLPTSVFYQCNDCNDIYISQRTLQEHACLKFQCDKCGRIVSSKSSLKLHQQTHEATKRYQCYNCSYSTGDHNAFRRHKMKHDSKTLYNCPLCNYKSIQSVPFRQHIKRNHQDDLKVVFKCRFCRYATVNSTLHIVHEAKHLVKEQQKPVNYQRTTNAGYTSSSSEVLKYCNGLAVNGVVVQTNDCKI